MYSTSVLLILVTAQVLSQPLDISKGTGGRQGKSSQHRMSRSLRTDSNLVEATHLLDNVLTRIRTKRSSEEDCEKLTLCRLHANSQHSFIDTFELYFVNKENARLWDHKTHTLQDCEQRFTGCYESKPAAKRTSSKNGGSVAHVSKKEFREDDSDEDYY